MKGRDSWQSLSTQTPRVSMATQEVFNVTGALVPGLQFWKVSESPLAQRDQVLFFFWRPIQEVWDTFLLAMAKLLSELTVTRSLKQPWQTDRGLMAQSHICLYSLIGRGVKDFSLSTWQWLLACSQVRWVLIRKSSRSAALQISIRAAGISRTNQLEHDTQLVLNTIFLTYYTFQKWKS